MNTFKVDGLTRALTRQPLKSYMFVDFPWVVLVFLVFRIFSGFPIKIHDFLSALFGATRGAKCPIQISMIAHTGQVMVVDPQISPENLMKAFRKHYQKPMHIYV